MDRAMQAAMRRLQAQRRRLADEGQEMDEELGRLASEMTRGANGESQQDVAASLGISRSQVQRLIKIYDESLTDEKIEMTSSVTEVSTYDEGIAYVRHRGLPVTRSITSFQMTDVLWASGVDPRCFSRSGDRVRAPSLLWKLGDSDHDEWVAVHTVSVGYGGNGPTLAILALEGIGVPREDAREIASYRFCDAVRLDDKSTWRTSQVWPQDPRVSPAILADRIVTAFGEALPRHEKYSSSLQLKQSETDETGLFTSPTKQSGWEEWIDFLDGKHGELPEWAKGPRTARIFVDPDNAREQGFTIDGSHPTPIGLDKAASIVLEQGVVQLWGFYYPPNNKGSLVSAEVSRVLKKSGLYNEELERDEPIWERLLRTAVGMPRSSAGYVDISSDGETSLEWTPGFDYTLR